MIEPSYIIPSLIIAYLILIFYFINQHLYLTRVLRLKDEDIKVEINTLNEQIKNQAHLQTSLEQRIMRYNNLKDLTERIQSLSVKDVCQNLLDFAYFWVGKNKGAALLYLVDTKKQALSLAFSKKEDKDFVIKQKTGDVFDHWVMKHSSSLLIEDAKEDFRFDLERTEFKPDRPILSLINSPFKVEQRFLGLLRLDNNSAKFYFQDDLRLLDTICNVGALGLENALLFQRTQDLAIHDNLTGVFTKGYFLKRLNEEVSRTLRIGEELCLLMLDIDNFKNYNDRFGHIAGDIVLKGLGKLLSSWVADISNAMVCRFGGEEFCAFLPDIPKDKIREYAEDVRLKVGERKFILRREETHITVSIGVASFSTDTADANELILKSDTALYRAKQRGKNQVCII